MSETLLLYAALTVAVTGCTVWLFAAVALLALLARVLTRTVCALLATGRHTAAAMACSCGGDMETCKCGSTGRPPAPPRTVPSWARDGAQ